MANASIRPGPAFCAPTEVRTNIPVPITQPMPNKVSWNQPRVLFSDLRSAVARMASSGLTRPNMHVPSLSDAPERAPIADNGGKAKRIIAQGKRVEAALHKGFTGLKATDVYDVPARHLDQPGQPHTAADAPADGTEDFRAQGGWGDGRAHRDAHGLYGPASAIARRTLRHPAGGRFAGTGHLRSSFDRSRHAGDDGQSCRGRRARQLSLRRCGGYAVRLLRSLAREGLRERSRTSQSERRGGGETRGRRCNGGHHPVPRQ